MTALGFAYAAQEMPEVPDSDHDMQLDAIVTERGVIVRPEPGLPAVRCAGKRGGCGCCSSAT